MLSFSVLLARISDVCRADFKLCDFGINQKFGLKTREIEHQLAGFPKEGGAFGNGISIA
jgi:hypothetical protein